MISLSGYRKIELILALATLLQVSLVIIAIEIKVRWTNLS